MNSSLNLLERPASVLTTTAVLAQNGITCTLLTLEPGTESALPAARSTGEQLLFVVDGDIALQAEAVTTIVNRGDAFLLAPGATPVVSARVGTPARVLRVEIPPREAATPQIITLQP
jgi:uncharacterized cupin superfamily protein